MPEARQRPVQQGAERGRADDPRGAAALPGLHDEVGRGEVRPVAAYQARADHGLPRQQPRQPPEARRGGLLRRVRTTDGEEAVNLEDMLCDACLYKVESNNGEFLVADMCKRCQK